jgi:hypothetical protein
MIAALAGAGLTALAVVGDEILPDLAGTLPSVPSWVTGGLAPFALTSGVAWGAMTWLRRRARASSEESAIGWFAGATASFAVLTLIGVLFRGEGMALRWPW